MRAIMNLEETVRASLLGFVTQSFNVTAAKIDMNKSLIDQGIIDSFGLIEIATFIEQEFRLVVKESDMTREAFGSMNKMARFISARMEKSA
jgi:acyl carrier protein